MKESVIFHFYSEKISESPWSDGRHIPLVAVLLLCLALIPATVSADGIDLVTVGSGTVSGGLWSDPGVMWNASWPSTGGVEVTKMYALPAYDDLDWARLYVAVSIGSTSAAKQTTVDIAIDGDGDGTFDSLAMESLNSTDIGVLPDKPYITRESSNYLLWYDVKGYLSGQNPSVRVNTTGSFDGRVKAVGLVAAYDDGDADRIYYWVNQGHFNGPGSTAFDLSNMTAAFEGANLTNFYLASTESTGYTFNGDTIAAYDSGKAAYSGYNLFDVNASLVSGANTFAWPGAGAYYRSILALLSVEAQPSDLQITAITPNANEIFANEPNTIAATVKNNGTASSGAFQVSFSINGDVWNVSVADLAAGNTTTVSVVDPTIRALGDPVTIVVTTDASPENNLTLTKSVVYNGYKGKRYTGGDDLTELTNFTVTGDLLYSTGDSAYLGGSSGWTTYTANWTSVDLAVPANATLEAAYLCAFYTYDKNGVMPDNASLSFNGVQVPYLAHDTDRKLYGSYNYPSGMVVYNVTGAFDPTGNGAVFTNLGTGGSSFNGMVLFVVYDDPAATEKQILFNAGYDILSGQAKYAATPEEATAYAPFAGIASADSARLITVAPTASAEGALLFGNQTWTTVWNYAGASNIGIDDRDVTAYLNASPVAAFRSDNDYFDAACAVLVLDLGAPVVQDIEITAITPNANEIFANEPNTIAATVKNNGTTASGAFSVQFSINGDVQDVNVSDLAAGNTTTVSVVDPTIRALGDPVTIVVTTDASPENNLTLTKSVVYNGYKGKRYTGGEDITELTNFTVTGDLLYSTGDSAYMGGSSGWTTYTANWTAADLAVPANAAVEAAYLCAFYTYDKNGVMPDNVSMAFNSVQVPYLAHYTDRKLYGSYNYPSGMVVYNVTDTFDPTGNGALFTNLGTGGSSFNGMTLFVVYEDSTATEKQILFNAGYDILSGKAAYAVTPEEATAYAPFTYRPLLGVTLSTVRLITVAPGASAEGTLLFGNQNWTTAWNYAGASNIGIDDRDVTAYLNASPVAAFRSDNDYFDAACAILVLEYGDPVVPPTPTPNSGGNDDSGTIAAAGDLSAGETASFSYSGTVSRVLVTVSRQTDGIMLAVTEKQDVPVDGPSGAVYCYLETDLSYTTDDGIEDAVFEFSVPLSWLAEQGLTARDVVLMRYHNGVWTALPTELIGESGNEAHYRATSPGFSYFAVVTEKDGASVAGESTGETPAVTATPTLTPEATVSTTPNVTAAPTTTGTTPAPATTPASPLWEVLPFAALGIFLLMKRK